ncbi:hypothetical protein [Ghiorsea bivora]|uniref:hypothetical protein n=1 Tax=Ghiorsea bivora TaxID=1485545 RepID=UPI00056FFEF9|nr:hypothetical protein [Ghiorsea bivora]
MYKLLMLVSFVIGMTVMQLSAADAAVGSSLEMNPNLTSQRMQTLRVMISKLRDLVYNLRDINQLEEIGMPRQDVLLMKNALQQKINQTQQETVAFIRRL